MKRIGVFVFYNINGEVNKSTELYLNSLKPFFTRLIIVVNGKISDAGKACLEKISDEIEVRENVGYDVCAYKFGIEYIGYDAMNEYDELILMNDSVYGPFFPLNELFESMESKNNVDFWGVTGHKCMPDYPCRDNPLGYMEAHIQSYFTAFKKTVFSSTCFKKYWDEIPVIRDKIHAIERHEVYATYYFAQNGFKWDCYLPVFKDEEHVDDILFLEPIKCLHEYRCPFVKKILFSAKRGVEAKNCKKLFDYIRDFTDYPIDVLYNDIISAISEENLWLGLEAIPRYVNMKEDNATLLSYVHELEDTLKNEGEASTQQQIVIERQSRTLESQQELAVNMQNMIDRQNRMIDERGLTIDSQKIKIDQQNRAIEEQSRAIEEQSRFIEEQRNSIDEQKITLEQQLEEIKRITAENRRLRSQYEMKCVEFDTISNAFFWKITKPMRVILDSLKYTFRNNAFAHYVWDTLKRIKNGGKSVTPADKVNICRADDFYIPGEPMVILCTKHTLFIAKLIKASLLKAGITADIITDEPAEYNEQVHIVICPQMFKKMPGRYIAFQMEQTVSSRWLTDSYYDTLNHAYATLDYSLVNVMFFKQNTEFGKNFYYVPVDYLNGLEHDDSEYEYDVLFYGDINNPRRKAIIEELQKHFSVKIVSEVFGDELYDELSKAKIVINIHYYESAMLETTRIYEVLSLGRSMVVSERSSDPEEEKRLEGIVDFVSVGDTDGMIERISYWLKNENERIKAVAENKQRLSSRSNAFDYFFLRFMLANDWIDFDKFYELCGDYVHFNGNRVCLSLPEAVDRREAFDNDNRFGFEVMPGLRHKRGWTGCGLSYKFIMKKAQEQGMEDILVCEDDVLFPDDFEQRVEKCFMYLAEHPDWDIFQGLMADVGKVKVSRVDRDYDQTFVWIDHMISTVFNYYRKNVYGCFINWDETNSDVYKNTIDRSLEAKKLKIVATAPFLVGHKEDLDSVIWGFNNTQYTDMIAKSSEKLYKLAEEFEKNNA